MTKFPPQDPAGASAAPDQGVKSAEYELADQDADRARADSQRPDLRPPRGNPGVEAEDVRRGQDKLERVIAK